MDAPFFKYGLFGDDFSLVVAFLIGIGFGFFLERAGFGSGNKLAAQFYFRDMAVLKVMFSAIVTAMIGVFFLSRFGLLDLSLVYLVPTKIWPNVVGGLVLGVGFVIGGYCPGTSIVASATGRVDAMLYEVGMFAGMFLVGFLWPILGDFVNVPGMGQITLAQLTNIPYGVLVAILVVVAALAFLAAEWGEVKSGAKAMADQPLLGMRGLTSSRKFVLGALALALLAPFFGSPYRGPFLQVDGQAMAQDIARGTDHIAPVELADRLVAGRNELKVIDLRSADEFGRYHLPGAENVPMVSLATTPWDPTESFLLYAENGEHAAQAWTYLKARRVPRVYTLTGGIDAWQRDVLFPQIGGLKPEDEAKRREVAKFFGGSAQGGSGTAAVTTDLPAPMPVVAPAPAAGGAPKVAAKKKKEGC